MSRSLERRTSLCCTKDPDRRLRIGPRLIHGRRALIRSRDTREAVWCDTTGGLASTVEELPWIRNEAVLSCVVSDYPAVLFFAKSKRIAMKSHDVASHMVDDMMGVASDTRPPRIRLSPHSDIASKWAIGTDVITPYPDATQMVMVMEIAHETSGGSRTERLTLVAIPRWRSVRTSDRARCSQRRPAKPSAL